VAEVLAHPGGIWALAVSPNGYRLATGGDDEKVAFWDVRVKAGRHPRLERRKESWRHRHRVFSVAFSPDGQLIASASEDQHIALAVADPFRFVERYKFHDNGVTDVAFERNERYLLSTSDGHSVAIWDRDTLDVAHGSPPWTARRLVDNRSAQRFNAVAAGHVSDVIAAGDSAGTILLWARAEPDPQPPFHLECPSPVLDLTFSPDDRTLAAGCMDGSVYLFDVADGSGSSREPRRILVYPADNPPTEGDVVARDGGAVADEPYLPRRHRAVTALCYLNDGRRLAVVGEADDAVSVFDVESGELALRYQPESLYEGMKIHGATLDTLQYRALMDLGADDTPSPTARSIDHGV
jgi:WD40 repeat protein